MKSLLVALISFDKFEDGCNVLLYSSYLTFGRVNVNKNAIVELQLFFNIDIRAIYLVGMAAL